MKTIVLAAALAAPLGLSNALADESVSTSFYALNSVTATSMTDHELDAVEGARRVKICYYCANVAFVEQVNYAYGSAFVFQANNVSQSNN